jgi:hypothetical protein
MNKSTNIFGQILQLVDRNVFQALVKKTGAEKNTKGFSSWDHFTSMLFCQIGNASPLIKNEILNYYLFIQRTVRPQI